VGSTFGSTAGTDVVIVGAGVIGLATAWRLTDRGLSVALVDPTPGTGASWTAAGMLAPVTELHYGEAPLLALNLESARRYAAFAAELADRTGFDVGYRPCGTVTAAWDSADLADVRALANFAAALGEPGEMLTGRELRALVPGIAPGLPGGFYASGDHQVDNRRLVEALLAATSAVVTYRRRAVELLRADDRATGVLLEDGTLLHAPYVVLAAGAWSGALAGLPADLLPPIRPVKGQTLRLRAGRGSVPDLTVRAAVRGTPVYVVPRAGGEVVVGASSEEAGFDVMPRAGAMYELLRDAQSVLPGLSEAEFVDVSTGLRPGTPDNAPLLGPTRMPGLIAATGHYRNGILLTPITADVIASVIVDGVMPSVAAPFTPDRFVTARAPVPAVTS
jgi:glycine oxidase